MRCMDDGHVPRSEIQTHRKLALIGFLVCLPFFFGNQQKIIQVIFRQEQQLLDLDFLGTECSDVLTL